MRKVVLFLLVFALSVSAFSAFASAEQTDNGASVSYGDVDASGKINLADASALLKYIANWDVNIVADAADVTANGRVNLGDVSRILQYVAKWDVLLGPKDEITDPGNSDREFVEADFNEAEFRILYSSGAAADYGDRYIWAEEFTSEVINDAVLERNRQVEAKYNVKIVAEDCYDPTYDAKIRIQAGQCDFNVIYDRGTQMKSLALWGCFYDFRELDYVNLEESYWLPKANRDLVLADRLYIATNTVSMNFLAHSDILYFNKSIMDELSFAYPYDYVDSDTWTYDVVIDMVMAAEKDVNKDGVLTNKDRFGGISGDVLLRGVCSAPLVEENGDGGYTFIPFTEKMVDQYNKYKSKLDCVENLTEDQIIEGKDISQFPSKSAAARFLSFGEGHTLFMQGNLEMTKEFVDMKDDYGIVPMPVVNAGDEYVAIADCSAPMFAIPLSVYDPEMTGIVFEYLAYESEYYLMPFYYETTIKTKRMQDTRDYHMLEIIRDSVRYNWTDLYMWDSDIAWFRDRILSYGTFVSTAKQYGAKIQGDINDIINKIKSFR